MQFLHYFMLFGLLAVAIPIVLQILTRRNVRRIPWGAWMFLDLTMKKRRRKVLLEDVLLLACRCLALGLLALGFARPFVRPDSPVPWAVTLPVLLLAMTAFGVSFALWRYPKQRRLLFYGGLALLALALATIVFERQLDLKRFGLGATKDVVLIVDASSSMTVVRDGKTNFERAVGEAKAYVDRAPRNTAFAVVAGGPVPQVMNPVPISDRRIVLGTLDALRPVNGTLRIGANLTAAAVTLAAGQNAVKQIVIVGDGQAVGWDLADKARWANLSKAFEAMKIRPIVTWRTLPLPSPVRNLAIESVRPVRAVVGTDRPVPFAVTLVNAGGEAVTPRGVVFTAEGRESRAPSVGQLEPGESRVFTFTHRFAKAGGTVVEARVLVEDDLPADDVCRYAMPVLGSLKILVLDGGSGGRLDRSATYVATALRPAPAPAADPSPSAAGGRDYLIEATVESAAAFAEGKTLPQGCSAVVLAGARRLPEATRGLLARFVASGGGLLVLPQAAIRAEDFDGWTRDGARVMPAPLGAWRANGRTLDAVSLAAPLERFRTGSDIGTATPARVLSFGDGWTSNATVIARLSDGSPFLLRHGFGRGSVVLAAADFDPASGLVAKRAFLPFVHELAYSLARPAAVTLDVRPSEGLSLLVASGSLDCQIANSEGLVGFYYPERGLRGKPRVRIDPNLDLNADWGSPFRDGGFPRDNFSVRWCGVFTPPKAGSYAFWYRADDRLDVRLGSHRVKDGASLRLEAKPYRFEAVFEEEQGRASAVFGWRVDGRNVPVPPSAFRTCAADGEAPGEGVSVEDPRGDVFSAEIGPCPAGLTLRLARSVTPGVYRVSGLSENAAQAMAGVVGADGSLRFTVSAGVEESDMTAATQADLSRIGAFVPVTQAMKDEDVVKSIGGESFGREVWRFLAIAAFLFLVLEPFVARWIAINRRTGDLMDMEGAWIRT